MVPPPLAALLELALELVLPPEPPEPPELELELLLEPHAATTSEAATASATALIRRCLKVISLFRSGGSVCNDRAPGVNRL